jgi:hypothetical protein
LPTLEVDRIFDSVMSEVFGTELDPDDMMGGIWTNSGHRQTAIAWPKSVALSGNQLAPPLGPLVDIVTPYPTDIPSSTAARERH